MTREKEDFLVLYVLYSRDQHVAMIKSRMSIVSPFCPIINFGQFRFCPRTLIEQQFITNI